MKSIALQLNDLTKILIGAVLFFALLGVVITQGDDFSTANPTYAWVAVVVVIGTVGFALVRMFSGK